MIGQTRYESINGSWYIVIESTDVAFVEAEINRLKTKAVFIGPHKVDEIYVAKGMMVAQ